MEGPRPAQAQRHQWYQLKGTTSPSPTLGNCIGIASDLPHSQCPPPGACLHGLGKNSLDLADAPDGREVDIFVAELHNHAAKQRRIYLLRDDEGLILSPRRPYDEAQATQHTAASAQSEQAANSKQARKRASAMPGVSTCTSDAYGVHGSMTPSHHANSQPGDS